MVLCVRINEAQNSQVLYTALSSFLRLNKILCGIKHGSSPYLEKKKIIVQNRKGFMLLFPLTLARIKENENIESRILIGCAAYTMKPVLYSVCCEENIVDEAVFWSTVQDELTRIKSSFVENIHSLPKLSFSICHY